MGNLYVFSSLFMVSVVKLKIYRSTIIYVNIILFTSNLTIDWIIIYIICKWNQRSDPPSSLSLGFLVVGGRPLGSGIGSAEAMVPNETTIAITANRKNIFNNFILSTTAFRSESWSFYMKSISKDNLSHKSIRIVWISVTNKLISLVTFIASNYIKVHCYYKKNKYTKFY